MNRDMVPASIDNGRQRIWVVRPSVLVAADLTPADVDKLEKIWASSEEDPQARLNLERGPRGGTAVTATVHLRRESAGRALDSAVAALERVCSSGGLEVIDVREVVALPADRDERNW